MDKKSFFYRNNIVESFLIRAVEQKRENMPAVKDDDIRFFVDKNSKLYFFLHNPEYNSVDVYALYNNLRFSYSSVGELSYIPLDNNYIVLALINLDETEWQMGIGSQLIKFFEYIAMKNNKFLVRGQFVPDSRIENKVMEFYKNNGYKINNENVLVKKLDFTKIQRENENCYKIGKYNCNFAKKVVDLDNEIIYNQD